MLLGGRRGPARRQWAARFTQSTAARPSRQLAAAYPAIDHLYSRRPGQHSYRHLLTPRYCQVDWLKVAILFWTATYL
jgi:hypothetical protein